MNNYSLLRNLSVVYHNQMLVPRSNAKTEQARINALDALMTESFGRKNAKTAINATNSLQAFHKAKDKDDTHEPMFKVI